MSDIVERLLARKHYGYEQGSRYPEYQGPHDPLCKEAADIIERQAKEIEMLRESNHGHWAEIERLQKELRLTQSDLQQACNLLGQERGKPLMVAMELFDKSRKDRIR